MEKEKKRVGRPKIYATEEDMRAAKRANQRRWREKNLERERAKSREREARRRLENPEKVRQATNAWRKKNPEKNREIMLRAGRKHMAKWRDEHPEESRQITAEWREKNRERYNELSRAYKAKRRAKKLENGGTYTPEDVQWLWIRQRGRCAFCLKKLSPHNYHIDHYDPLVLGGSNGPKNLRLLHPKCNLRKRSSDPLEHAQKHGLLCW